jgi:O-antigen/teichoic acid export membrane protein
MGRECSSNAADMQFSRKTITDYLTITSGVFGRLAVSVVYFLIVANVLTLAEFGIFAAVSATGLVLSRIMSFGFVSPVFRVATVKPRLLGVYTGGLLAFVALSLPVVISLGLAIHAGFFAGRIAFVPFSLIIAAELGWRLLEYVVIVLNGLSRFRQAATLVVLGSALRAVAAVVFYLGAARGLDAWVQIYAAANAVSVVIAVLAFAPRVRIRLRFAVCGRRMRDALSAAVSELAFYAQSELDKLLVLALAGDRTAGLYAIAMRLIDLTAIPVRSFNQMLVQKIMRDGGETGGLRRLVLSEAAIGAVSVAGFMAFIVLLWIWPQVLGNNIARVAPLLPLLLLVPAFRNLIEYHGELLYAREQVVSRLVLLVSVGVLKFALTALLIRQFAEIEHWSMPLNAVFLLLYALSAITTFRLLRR